MSTTPRDAVPGQEKGTREGAGDVPGGHALPDGTVDPFQDPDLLAGRMPEGESLVPGAPRQAGSGPDQPADHVSAAGGGAASANEDADRFDAG